MSINLSLYFIVIINLMVLFFFSQDRYKNLAAIKLTEWDEPKMLLKILLEYFKRNPHQTIVLFHLLPAFSCRFPVDINVS